MTAVRVPAGIDGGEFLRRLETRFGLKLAGGQAQLKGRIFRISHFGLIDELDMIGALAAIEMTLNELGRPVKLGVAVAAASEVLIQFVPSDLTRPTDVAPFANPGLPTGAVAH